MTDQNQVMSQEDEMAELLAIYEAEQKAKKDAEDNKGTFTEFEHVECLGLEDQKEKAFRIVGRGFQNRKLPTDAKIVMQSSIRTDDGKGYTKINWPIVYNESKGDYFPDPDWLFTRLYEKINEGKSAKYTEADIDGKKIVKLSDGKIVNKDNKNKEWYWNPYHRDTDVFMRVKSNMRDNATPKEFAPTFYPGKRIVINVIDRMDDWCIVNKHTKELSSKVSYSEKKNDKGETVKVSFPELGIPKLCYDSIINSYLKTSGSFTAIDTIIVKDSTNKKYDVLDALDTRRLKETKDIANSNPLTEEEKAYELYDFDNLYRVASYAKLKKNLSGLFKLCDADLGTNFYDELVNLCKTEDEQRKAEEKAKAELEASKEKFYWIHQESDSCGIEKTREDMDKTLNSDQCVTECTKEQYEAYKKSLEPVQAEEPKTRSRETRQPVESAPQKSIDELCIENFPCWDKLPENEKQIMINSIISFNGTVPIYKKEAKDVLCNDTSCHFKDSTEETTYPATVFTCPMCGRIEEK